MTNQNDGASTGGEPVTGAPPIIKAEPENPVPSKPATEADLEQVKNQMSGFERSTLGWTRASFIVILATGIFIALQWHEMHAGGQDTHDLAVAAGKQADAAKGQSEQAKAQTEKMTESLARTDNLVSATSELARQAKRSADVSQRAIELAVKDSAQNAARNESQLKILQDQAKAARDQADAALKSAIAIQKQTEVAERPWLSVEAMPASNLFFVNGEQAALTLKLSIKNVGKSIAKAVQTSIKLFPAPPGMPVALDAAQQQRELCDNDKPQIGAVGAFDLFPIDRPTEQLLSISAMPSQVTAQSVTLAGDKSRRFVGLYVIGCLYYHSSFGLEVHKTRFGYHLISPGITSPDGKLLTMPDGMPLMTGFEVGVEVPKDKLGMMQELFARNDAN